MDDFFNGIASIIERARTYAGRTADWAMCAAYFEIGRMIVEREQGGSARAEYGRGLLAELAEYLTGRFGKGFSKTNLKYCRQFYLMYAPSIGQTMSDQSENRKPQAIAAERDPQKSQTLSGEFATLAISMDNQIIRHAEYPLLMFIPSLVKYLLCLLRYSPAATKLFYLQKISLRISSNTIYIVCCRHLLRTFKQ